MTTYRYLDETRALTKTELATFKCIVDTYEAIAEYLTAEEGDNTKLIAPINLARIRVTIVDEKSKEFEEVCRKRLGLNTVRHSICYWAAHG